MQQRWFKKAGWLYFPIHPIGFIVTLLAIFFMVPVSMAINRNGHSISDDLYQMFVYGTCTSFWWKWVAEKTSNKNSTEL
ncbi:MAG: hypothetical protein ABI760_05735 [Ferruginibacter sp.]